MNYSQEQRNYQDKGFQDNFYNKYSVSNPSTPLSINKTQSNFNQEDFQSSQYFPALSPLSLTENRRIKKSITPYPIWNTAEDYRNRKEDSLLITDYDNYEDKENIVHRLNVPEKCKNNQFDSQSPCISKKVFQEKGRQSSMKKSKNLQLSNGSKNLIKQSIKKAIECSNVKTAVNFVDVMSIDSGSDVLGTLSKSSKKSRKNQKQHINIQQSSCSPSNIHSSSQTMNMIPMVLSKRPQDDQNQHQRQEEESNDLSQDNEVIEYFLTEEDSQTEYNMSNDGYNVLNQLKSQLNSIMDNIYTDKMHSEKTSSKFSQSKDKAKGYTEQGFNNEIRMFKKSDNSLSYCDILQSKIKQLSNNITTLHEKVLNTQSYSVSSHSTLNQNKKNSTMQSLDSKPDYSNSAINIKHLSSLQLQINKNQNGLKKLIYHDSKIIFSKNDSGFIDFTQEFSQILNDTCQQIHDQKISTNRKDQSHKILFQNSPVSIDISQQLDHILGNNIGKSQKGSQLSNKSQKSQKSNILQEQNLSQNDADLIFQNQSYLKNQSLMQSPESSNFMTMQKQPFRLSSPNIFGHNQSQLSHSDIYDSSPKMKQRQSFISSSSNQTFIQQQFNKKFNNKFNQWLLMS